jgi:hypothetical protein
MTSDYAQRNYELFRSDYDETDSDDPNSTSDTEKVDQKQTKIPHKKSRNKDNPEWNTEFNKFKFLENRFVSDPQSISFESLQKQLKKNYSFMSKVPKHELSKQKSTESSTEKEVQDVDEMDSSDLEMNMIENENAILEYGVLDFTELNPKGKKRKFFLDSKDLEKEETECKEINVKVQLSNFTISFLNSPKPQIPVDIQDSIVDVVLHSCNVLFFYDQTIYVFETRDFLSFAEGNSLLETFDFEDDEDFIIGNMLNLKSFFDPEILYQLEDLKYDLIKQVTDVKNPKKSSGILKSNFKSFFTKKGKFKNWGGLDNKLDELPYVSSDDERESSLDFEKFIPYELEFEVTYLKDTPDKSKTDKE